MKKLMTIIMAAGIVFVSCEREDSDSVKQDKIYTSYILEYNTDNDLTYARANFQFSNATGTKLELVAPAKVLVNDEKMNFEQTFAYYEKTFSGVKNSLSFEYIDVDENLFNNTVKILPSIEFSNLPDTLSRSNSFQLEWNGDPVKSGEVVTVTINGSGEQDGLVFTQASVGETSIVLPANQLEKLGLENSTFYIRRSKDKEADEVTSAGGKNISRYDGGSETVYITQ